MAEGRRSGDVGREMSAKAGDRVPGSGGRSRESGAKRQGPRDRDRGSGPGAGGTGSLWHLAAGVWFANPSSTSSKTKTLSRSLPETINLIVTFIIYLSIGAFALTLYEPEMSFFKGLYFNFVTLTTIGILKRFFLIKFSF